MNEVSTKSLVLDKVMEQALADAGSSAALIADFDEALDAAIPRGYLPTSVMGLGRFSAKKQKERSSESRQVARILAVCARYGWPSPSWIMLRGVSGWRRSKNGIPHNLDPKRSELGRFLLASEAGQVPAGTLLIVDNPDRFSRTNPDAADHALMTLLRNGVSVLFLSMQMLLRAGDQDNVHKRGEVMNELARANREGNTKSKYIRDAIAIQIEKAKEGHPVNFGGKVPRWIKWDKTLKQYAPNAEKWATVCRIVNEALDHKVWGQIVRDLNANKVPCLLGGKAWQHPTVYQLLRNPALLGHCKIRNITLANYLPAVVNEAQWNLLQARLAVVNGRGGGCRKMDRIRNLFPGLVVCHRCGMPMRATMDTAPYESSFVCKGHIIGIAAEGSGKRVCDESRTVKVSAIELDFFGLLIEKMPSTLLLQRNEVRQAEITRLRAEIAQHTTKITRLGRLFTEINTDTRDLVQDMEKARDQIAELQSKERTLLKEANVDVGADAAWTSVMQVLEQQSPREITNLTLDTLRNISAKLRTQLADNELRKRLIGPVKMLVSAIEVDVDRREKRYRAKLLGGGYTEWRDVSDLNADLIEANLRNGHRNARSKMSESARARFAKNPMTAEYRAKIAKGIRRQLAQRRARAVVT